MLDPKEFSRGDQDPLCGTAVADEKVLSPRLYYEASRRLTDLHDEIREGRFSSAEEYLFLELFLVSYFKRHPDDLRISMLWDQLNRQANGVHSALRQYARAEDVALTIKRMTECEERSRVLAHEQEHRAEKYLRERLGAPR